MNDEDEYTDRPGSGYTALAGAMIRGALQDMALDDPVNAQVAREFFASAWFDELAAEIDLDPDAVRDRLRARGLL